jgi:hypothetical protein
MDLFVVPTFSFRLLYGVVILNHGRRQILWLRETAHPTSEWMARQLTEACGWDRTPEYIVRDRDAVYGEKFIRRLRAMGIRDRPTAARTPWQNGRGTADWLTPPGMPGPCHCPRRAAPAPTAPFVHGLLQQSANTPFRTHLSVNKDAPVPRAIEAVGQSKQAQFSVDYTISMSGPNFPTRTAALLYLPPYSPDFNPIENALAKLKAHL